MFTFKLIIAETLLLSTSVANLLLKGYVTSSKTAVNNIWQTTAINDANIDATIYYHSDSDSQKPQWVDIEMT